jgi:hypothetical protein
MDGFARAGWSATASAHSGIVQPGRGRPAVRVARHPSEHLGVHTVEHRAPIAVGVTRLPQSPGHQPREQQTDISGRPALAEDSAPVFGNPDAGCGQVDSAVLLRPAPPMRRPLNRKPSGPSPADRDRPQGRRRISHWPPRRRGGPSRSPAGNAPSDLRQVHPGVPGRAQRDDQGRRLGQCRSDPRRASG